MKSLSYLVPSASALLVFTLASCENPADGTADAEVSDAVEIAAESEGAVRYVITRDSEISFVGSKVTGSHDGGFKDFAGHFSVDGDEAVTGGEIVIDMESTWADDDKLTGHLKSEDFFHIEAHPESVFTVTSVEKNEDGGYMVSGNLKLRGEEKNITFPATASTTADGVKIDAEFDINRTDWGIVYKGKADDLIREEVVIRFDLTAKPEGAGGPEA
jgi:polyisoprenoid-binding protein YceI